jgi:hypothetical protein
MPISVAVQQDSVVANGSPSVTTVQLATGGGSFNREIVFGYTGSSGCASSTPIHFDSDFTDIGAEIDYGSGGLGHIGVRGGFVHETANLVSRISTPVNVDSIAATIDPTQNYTYVNPYVSVEGTWIGLGLGIIASSQPLRTGAREDYPPDEGVDTRVSGHLRLGHRSHLYGSASTGESVPIYSGGGITTYGFGVVPVSILDIWGGGSSGPWQGDHWLFRIGLHPTPNWSINTNIRLEKETPFDEVGSGLSLGVTRRFHGD